jgi:predicted ABC-type ATPase
VPENRTRERYARSLGFLPRAMETVDFAWLTDRSDDLAVVVFFEEV